MYLPDNGLVAAAEEEVMNKATKSLNSEEREENESDDLMSCVVFVLVAVC